MSPEEAKTLFASVDEIFKFASSDTGFAIQHSVKRELVNRDVVQKYVESRMKDDEDAKRLERSEIVLKKFGLLPRDFDLHTFLVGLLREQVAGYYDVNTKTIYLLDWVDAEAQQPVLAHELTHALQDQNYDLKKWSDLHDPHKKKDERFEYDEDEESMARDAVAEGQAMVVLVDYMLRPSGHTLADSPQIGKTMRDAMGKTGDSPMLDRAPLMLRESLIYPYRDGLDFEQQLLSAGGKQLAFNGAFKQPPQDTHEILEPAAYLAHKPVFWIPLPDFRAALGKTYEKYDVGSVGEFDTGIIVEQYVDNEASTALAPSWRGGSYFAAKKVQPKGATQPLSISDISLLYISRWATDEDADQFAHVYGSSLVKRYKQAQPSAESQAKCPSSTWCSSMRFNTEEGPVIIERLPHSAVLITEGFEPEIQRQLKAQLQSDSVQEKVESDLMRRLTQSAIVREALKNMVLRKLAAKVR